MAGLTSLACLLALVTLLVPTHVAGGDWAGAQTTPSESECRPFIEKALKELGTSDSQEETEIVKEAEESPPISENEPTDQEGDKEGSQERTEEKIAEGDVLEEAGLTDSGDASTQEAVGDEPKLSQESQEVVDETGDKDSVESVEAGQDTEAAGSVEEADSLEEEGGEKTSAEQEGNVADNASAEENQTVEGDASQEGGESAEQATEEEAYEKAPSEEREESQEVEPAKSEEEGEKSEEADQSVEEAGPVESVESVEDTSVVQEEKPASEEDQVREEEVTEEAPEPEPEAASQETEAASQETEAASQETEAASQETEAASQETEPTEVTSQEAEPASTETTEPDQAETEKKEETSEEGASAEADQPAEAEVEEVPAADEPVETPKQEEAAPESAEEAPTEKEPEEQSSVSEEVTPDEEDLTMSIEIPEKLRPRDHITEILRLDTESAEMELLLSKTIDVTLRDLKKLYEAAIKPLEILYKYRDLSNRHFGDPEIFSKPLILFMGPWSGGKSTIINYLLDNEYRQSALRTGAEPSPAYFNIVMWGERGEVLDGTQLAADWTFSGLQKFGQGLLDRLKGHKLNHPLLEKVNIVEIPGILEIRKQVERLFPFNDACQWFIDRADIIFLVYDPSKLDVGPESEAILDQLKGREYQTRIILNKADQVKPEELMRVQGTLIWNISPLMSSTEPPVMYSTSLWSLPYESGAPTRLLYAQEKAFLRDLREAIDKRVENKIASARRFAVRVRNHAKMVDCYLTTYYNHKSFFGNRKKVSDDIIEHPQNYHIYEGLSTLTNISRYDLPDPDVYKDFFRLNPVYDFQQLAATCTYFRGCPINRLDVAIAYELPELVGKYKKAAEEVLATKKIDKS